MKKLTLLIACLITIQSFAQTDIIEMRSRNASLKKYAHARVEDGDHVTSNFGMEPPNSTWNAQDLWSINHAVLDSVKWISDDVAVMYTSQYCSVEPVVEARSGVKWSPGIDTVFNHPLFSHNHALDSVKMALDMEYYFRLPADSVKFIGFDNGAPIETEKSIDLPPKKEDVKRKSSIGWPLLFMLFGPLLCAYLFGSYLVPKTEH